jgi:hypothetical protein
MLGIHWQIPGLASDMPAADRVGWQAQREQVQRYHKAMVAAQPQLGPPRMQSQTQRAAPAAQR